MAQITLKGNAIETIGQLPELASAAPDFNLIGADLAAKSLKDYQGSRLILNIFPSVDTGTCAMSVRQFNEKASSLKNTKVLCISKDLPFAFKRFCGAEGIENVETLSDFVDGQFGKDYGLTFKTGPLIGLLSRSVVVLDENHKVLHAQQVAETTAEPDYEAAIGAL